MKKTFSYRVEGEWESEKFQTSEPGGGLVPPDFFLKGDSVIVSFDGTKKSFYTGVYSERNILYEENYEISVLDGHNTVRGFTFTEADYENAEEI